MSFPIGNSNQADVSRCYDILIKEDMLRCLLGETKEDANAQSNRGILSLFRGLTDELSARSCSIRN